MKESLKTLHFNCRCSRRKTFPQINYVLHWTFYGKIYKKRIHFGFQNLAHRAACGPVVRALAPPPFFFLTEDHQFKFTLPGCGCVFSTGLHSKSNILLLPMSMLPRYLLRRTECKVFHVYISDFSEYYDKYNASPWHHSAAPQALTPGHKNYSSMKIF